MRLIASAAALCLLGALLSWLARIPFQSVMAGLALIVFLVLLVAATWEPPVGR